jgi:hypothetical protein
MNRLPQGSLNIGHFTSQLQVSTHWVIQPLCLLFMEILEYFLKHLCSLKSWCPLSNSGTAFKVPKKENKRDYCIWTRLGHHDHDIRFASFITRVFSRRCCLAALFVCIFTSSIHLLSLVLQVTAHLLGTSLHNFFQFIVEQTRNSARKAPFALNCRSPWHARKLIWKTRLIKFRLRNNDQEVDYEAGGVSKAPLEIIPLKHWANEPFSILVWPKFGRFQIFN